MHCRFIDDASRHFVQCWVAGAQFPLPNPMSPTWRACHCFQSNICLGGRGKGSSDLGEAWCAGEPASRLEVGFLFRRGLGLSLYFHQRFLVWVFAVYPQDSLS